MIDTAAHETSTMRKMSMNNEDDFSYDLNDTRRVHMDTATVRFGNPLSSSSRHVLSDSGYKRRKVSK